MYQTQKCDEAAAHPKPECDCWTSDNPLIPWSPASEWDQLMFFNVPSSYMAGMTIKVCDKNSRIAHMLAAEGSLGMDVELVTTDPENRSQVIWVQKGFCYECCRYEWRRLYKSKPSSPVAWIKCTKKKAKN